MEARRSVATRTPGPCNPGVEGNPSDLFGDFGSGARCSIGRRTRRELLGRGRGRSRSDGGRRKRCTTAGGPRTEATRARKATAERTAMTPTPKKNANTGTVDRKARRGPGNTRPTVVSARNAESQGHGTLGTLATSARLDPWLSKYVRFWRAFVLF